MKQIERVERQLKRDGYVSRNYFLDLPKDKITRLAAIIGRLREQGMDITTEETGRDTIYRAKPKKVENYIVTLPDGTKEGYTKPIWN